MLQTKYIGQIVRPYCLSIFIPLFSASTTMLNASQGESQDRRREGGSEGKINHIGEGESRENIIKKWLYRKGLYTKLGWK